MRRIYAIGEIVFDIIFQEGVVKEARAGGSSLNCSVSLGRLSANVSLISAVGNDEHGKIIDNFLKTNNVNTDFIERKLDGKTTVALAFLDENQNANYSIYKDNSLAVSDVSKINFSANDLLICGSLFSVSEETYRFASELMENANCNNSIVYYDPNFRKQYLAELEKLMPRYLLNTSKADIIRGSDEDFFYLFGTYNAQDIFYKIPNFQNKVLIYTKGSKGVELITNRLHISMETPEIEPVSTIGAGDNFNAGILYMLVKENITKDNLLKIEEVLWKKILKTAQLFAADVCMQFGNSISEDFALKIRSLEE